MNLLIVEDEVKVATFLKKGLEEQGHHVDVATDLASFRETTASRKFDFILLDILLPGTNGKEICSWIRANDQDVPIIMLTALGSLQDKLESFDCGADDYLVKPFEFKELLARIKALSKRSQAKKSETHTLKFNEIELDVDRKIAIRNKKEILLSAKEFGLLELLMRNPGKVLSRTEIAEKIWEITFDTGTNVVDVYINLLRKKIDKDYPKKLIHTRIGMGYVFQED
jgi:two-component system, OmpR family, copper resistance phosphate regulon response regulator CusR